jgi:hypothetical protein
MLPRPTPWPSACSSPATAASVAQVVVLKRRARRTARQARGQVLGGVVARHSVHSAQPAAPGSFAARGLASAAGSYPARRCAGRRSRGRLGEPALKAGNCPRLYTICQALGPAACWKHAKRALTGRRPLSRCPLQPRAGLAARSRAAWG